MSLAAGTKLGPYEIRSRIGAGGMGEVYLAHDERLDRDVAVKVLAAAVADDPDSASRLRREARALSRLNHPNIAAVYDFDTRDGVTFIAMEYVSGRALGDMASQGALAEDRLLDLALQLADGLVAAHREGVIHRDLKPGNLRLTSDGRLKILDFGLAIAPSSADDVTQTASEAKGVVGTVPYMAPEQLRGAPVDVRTDVYAAGVVLYELATGRRPFTEPVAGALIDAILHARPPAPRQVRRELSPALEGIIVKCLEREPGFRYQSAAELLADLKRAVARSAAVSEPRVPAPAPAAAPVATQPAVATARLPRVRGTLSRLRELFGLASHGIRSIAVLPFDNFSRDPSEQYFVDGLTETLTTHLAQIRSIRVIGRTSVMQFAGEKKPPIPEIAGVLGVDAVVEGSVLRDGARVRITAQLVAAAPERHVWASTYDRDLRDILEIHKEVSQSIAREIRATLSPDEKARLSQTRVVNPEAYQAYLRGRQALVHVGPEYWAEAEKAFVEAIARDESFAPAHSGLAVLRLWVGAVGGAVPPRVIASQVRSLVARALALDPSLPEGLAAEASLNLYADWDWPTAHARLKHALEVSPSDGVLYHPYADYLLMQGKLEESVEYCRRAAALDPLSPVAHAVVAKHLSFLRRWDELISIVDGLLVSAPNEPFLRSLKGSALWEMGDYAGAIEELARALPVPLAAALRRGQAEGGAKAAVRAVARGFAGASRSRYVSPYTIATWFAMAGDTGPTLEWLENAYEDRTPFLLHLKAEPCFDFVREEPRFRSIVDRIGFPDAVGEAQPAGER